MYTARIVVTTVGTLALGVGSALAQPAHAPESLVPFRPPAPLLTVRPPSQLPTTALPLLTPVQIDSNLEGVLSSSFDIKALLDKVQPALDERDFDFELPDLDIHPFNEVFDVALLMPSAEQARAQAEAQAESSESARMRARAKAVEAQVEAQAKAVQAQVEAAAREFPSGFYFHGLGDFQYGRVIRALDRGLYEEALSGLKKLSETPLAPRESDLEGPKSLAVRPDAITYWMAYSHYKLGEAKAALDALDKLSKNWPDSGWRNDARALEIEIRQVSGQPVRPEAIEDAELKILALQGLVRAGRPEAMPALERIVFGVNPPRVKERAMFVLAQNPSPRAREVMVKVIKGGANPDLQVVAVRHLAAFGPESAVLLTDAYGATSDTRVKEAVILQLAARQRAKALVSLARTEKDANLKRRIVERLGQMKSKEATDYLLEIVNK